ncbi:MFS transporter [Mycobacterium sp.]|jgi:MFS family permease|uniref:MFS transporter n=1 Tax=Mycobacterium sp. TaxID=1785 RepID=UPI002B92446C|nr:MFS transporter [Mycobacterium sp.]HTH86619.1 MFS transporter [Mycobacterium sp.]
MASGDVGPAASPSSTWAPLKVGVFRGLFLAALTSNIGTWMQTVGAQWFLVEQHASATTIALVQTASLSPTLILALFAGALADRVDRRRLLIALQVYAAAAAAVLTAITVAGVLNPLSLLSFLFAMGCAAAMTTPAWQAIQPELVPREQFPAAASLSGLTVDAARAIGPPIAGVLVAATGPEAVFAINAVSFVAVVAALVAWKRPPSTVVATREPFSQSVAAGIRYVRDSKPVRRILLRAALFGFPVSALWALLPLAASQHWHLRAIGYGAVLGTVGVGAVLGVLVMSRLRAACSANTLLAIAALVDAGGLLAAAYLPLAAGVVVLLLSGVAWIATLTTLTVAAQLSLPQWVHARGLAMYLVVLIGAQALGALVWGLVASRFGLTASLTTAAVLLIGTAVSMVVLPLLPEPGVGHPLPSDDRVN